MKNIINIENISFKDLLFLNKMIIPRILTVLYWLSLAGILLVGLGTVLGSFAVFRYSFLMGSLSFLGGILTIIIGFISLRITFELVCVLFNINQNLKKLVEIQSSSEDKASLSAVAKSDDVGISIISDKR